MMDARVAAEVEEASCRRTGDLSTLTTVRNTEDLTTTQVVAARRRE
ncbi:hypothetical protein PC116_g33378 [Phytophthora cactorum]|nr:hypothetical protein PC116_g33378 [Phytophthora cactorum]